MRYHLAEFGIPWDDDLDAADNAVILTRHVARRVMSRVCWIMKLKLAVDSRDDAKILEQAGKINDLRPSVLEYSESLYRTACRIAKETA